VGAAIFLLLLASPTPTNVVVDGQAALRLEGDRSGPSRFAADLVRRHVVLMTGAALPEQGTGPALRFRATAAPGYTIEMDDSGVLVSGADLARAAYDILEGWGCRFGGEAPEVPRVMTLRLDARSWRPRRHLTVETGSFDSSIPADGVALLGIDKQVPALARTLGYSVRVASVTFDDFLPPKRFAEHPEWFALRGGRREARGNFALTHPAARAAYLDAVAAWLEAHPEVDRLGIWPEVTSVWCEESAALGHAEAYALLWREAAARFPQRRFEILATGLTLKPPQGPVPANVEVRLRPGRDASGLQGLAGQGIDVVVKAWEARGARVVLEIDAAPASWCNMPWPCHDAVRENAVRFSAAVLRRGSHEHARLWRDPARKPPAALLALLTKARTVRSWGHPRDAADLFDDPELGLPHRIGAIERLYRLAVKGRDASAAKDVYLGYRAILDAMPDEQAHVYRRYRQRDYRRMLEDLLPDGAEMAVGPAKVRDSFDAVEIEIDRLRLRIDRRTATVSVRHLVGREWGKPMPRAFSVVAMASKTERTDGRVSISSPGTGLLRIDIGGRLSPGGPRWRARLDLRSASGKVHQTAEVMTPGGIAVGCKWNDTRFDHFVCPPYATEGPIRGQPVFSMPAGTLLYCRKGARGPGLAVRPVHRASVSVSAGDETSLVAAHPGRTIEVDWIFFTDNAELGH